MKVKIFRFRVSNWTSIALERDKTDCQYKEAKKEVMTEEQIETIVNDFIREKNIVSIDVSTVDVEYHNNGRGNTVDLIYTIVYKEDGTL